MKRFVLLSVPALLLGWALAATADEVTFGKLKSKTPDTWKKVELQGKFRLYQFTVPKAGEDRKAGEVAVFFFATGAGTADENIKRQQDKFVPAEGQKLVSSRENFKVGDAEVAYLDISGTYKFTDPSNPKAKEERLPGYRMLYVFFQTDSGLYTVRLVGPAKTVEENKKGFEGWIKGFK